MPKLKKIIFYVQCYTEIIDQKNKIKLKTKYPSHNDFLKVAIDGANLVSLLNSFHNLAPR